MRSDEEITIQVDNSSFESNEIVIKITIPANLYTAGTNREIAERIYDLMVGDPRSLDASRTRPLQISSRSEFEELINLPKGWYVWYCTTCCFSATFDAETMESYGDDWRDMATWATNHEH